MYRRTFSEEDDLSRSKGSSDVTSLTCPASGRLCLNSVDTMYCINEKLKLLRHYMLVPWVARSCVTVFVVSFLSLLQGADEITHVDALTAKDSILNQVFVKMGWAWSLCAVFLLILSLLPLAAEPLHAALTALARLVLLSALFYFWCSLVFPAIEHWTGLCLSKNVVVSRHSKHKCVKNGHTFYSFDISGHSFLMVYCVMTLMQEAQATRRYISMGDAIAKLQTNGDSDASGTTDSNYTDRVKANEPNYSDQLKADETETENHQLDSDEYSGYDKEMLPGVDGEVADPVISKGVAAAAVTREGESVSLREAAKFRSTYMFLWPLVCASYCCVCFLCFTWDVVLIITTVYYHSLIEKIIGVVLAIASWALLYRGLFVKLKI